MGSWDPRERDDARRRRTNDFGATPACTFEGRSTLVRSVRDDYFG